MRYKCLKSRFVHIGNTLYITSVIYFTTILCSDSYLMFCILASLFSEGLSEREACLKLYSWQYSWECLLSVSLCWNKVKFSKWQTIVVYINFTPLQELAAKINSTKDLTRVRICFPETQQRECFLKEEAYYFEIGASIYCINRVENYWDIELSRGLLGNWIKAQLFCKISLMFRCMSWFIVVELSRQYIILKVWNCMAAIIVFVFLTL